jgi:hypothetical protein
MISRRGSALGIAVAGLMTLAGCAGGLRFDARTIERRCGVVAGTELSREQAVCMARLAGLKESRRCPFEIADVRDPDRGDAFRVRESCSGLAVSISRSDATVIVVELDRVIARFDD